MKPILFSTPMVQSILTGQKTMTRRVVKNVSPVYWCSPCNTHENIWLFHSTVGGCQNYTSPVNFVKCPYGQVGDLLWVRETWVYKTEISCFYKADNNNEMRKWKPSIFMPRWASRITLEITSVRVERLNDITIGDSMKEGFCEDEINQIPPWEGFYNLWEKLNGKKYPWSSNPYVWVIEFKKLKVTK